jgi:hypothetical protein
MTKRIPSWWPLVVIVLAFGAPLGAVAAQSGQAEEAGLSRYLPFIVVGIVLVLLVARQLFMRPNTAAPSFESGRPRSYGVAGAAICRNCGRPFARSAFDLNLLLGKLVRCPYCRKWAILPAASPAELAAAEERERLMFGPSAEGSGVTSDLSEEEQLRRRIENSKYE